MESSTSQVISFGTAALPGFEILFVILVIYGCSSFLRRDGQMKRGLKVGAQPLPTDIEHSLRSLPNGFVDGRGASFIRKDGETAFIQPVRFLHGQGEYRLPCVGCVDLSAGSPVAY